VSLSLHSRLLLAATMVLAAFLGLTGLALDRAFRNGAEVNVQDRLQAHLYGLLAAADLGADGRLVLPDVLPETRFSQPASGLFAHVRDRSGKILWRSPSHLGGEVPGGADLTPGVSQFKQFSNALGESFFLFHYGVTWELGDGSSQNYTFVVAENLRRFDSEVSAFRRSIWFWLGGAALLLLIVQGVILHWGLNPLRRVADQVHLVESGQQKKIEGTFPRELSRLTSNINTFIRNERENLDRYRNTLGDLAHSLKTPLAVLRGIFDADDNKKNLAINDAKDQIDRMTNIVDHQLKRAATSGKATLLSPVDLAVNLDKVVASLQKVYHQRSIKVIPNVQSQLKFYGEEGDLLEILGNLLDNAFKWCRKEIVVNANALGPESQTRRGLKLTIVDDGPGIPEELVEQVLARGVRINSMNAGQGIGLSVVSDIVSAYHGSMSIEKSADGGTLIELELPGN